MMKTTGLVYFSIWMGEIMGALKLNQIRRVRHEQGPYVLKRRHWFSPLLMEAGNAYFRLHRTRIRLLRNPDWLRREQEVNRMLYGEEIESIRAAG